ncbi:hypothetical protein Bpfe_017885 [Biomphalaria pfeifferi]|uniref:Uncharacterized protein n=1 Tax=Biomphalaria pfeifferi TaxID=112525 RepID=A0AAD8BDT8_BIOPF|nr:hypothetical protein Bpfe_017885 [Biomphalaria pfeifferi]
MKCQPYSRVGKQRREKRRQAERKKFWPTDRQKERSSGLQIGRKKEVLAYRQAERKMSWPTDRKKEVLAYRQAERKKSWPTDRQKERSSGLQTDKKKEVLAYRQAERKMSWPINRQRSRKKRHYKTSRLLKECVQTTILVPPMSGKSGTFRLQVEQIKVLRISLKTVTPRFVKYYTNLLTPVTSAKRILLFSGSIFHPGFSRSSGAVDIFCLSVQPVRQAKQTNNN